MLRPVQMRQLSIIVPKAQLHNFLTYAGQEQVLHLISVPSKTLPDGAEPYDVINLLSRSSSIRNRIATVAAAIGNSDGPAERIEAPIGDIEALTNFLDKETSRLEQSVKQGEEAVAKLQTERERAQELARFLGGLESAGVPLDAIGGRGFLGMLAGEVGAESVHDAQGALDDLTYGNSIFAITGSSGKTQTFLAVFPSPFQDDARQTLTGLGAKLEPPWEGLPSDASDARKTVEARLDQIDQSARQVQREEESRVKELGPKVQGLGVLAEILEVRTRALMGSTTTQETCLLQAWVPSDRIKQFTDGSDRACNGLASIHIEAGRPKHHEHGHEPVSSPDAAESGPPTLVRVPGWASSLQSIVNNFGIPSYHETNPLIFMVVSYPVIYGLMFGDFGQGPIFILFGFLLLTLRKRKVKVWDIITPIVNGAELIILLGIGITAFGFVFGDFFGFESSHVFGFPALFSPAEGALEGRIDHLQTFMVITLLFGVAHYSFGLALSAYNKLHRHEYGEAFFGPICWLWFYLSGVYLVALVAQNGFDFSIALARPDLLALTLVPWGLMMWKEGGLHAIEAFLSGLSNTISYLRIWALNIADFFFKVALFASFGIPGAIIGNILVMIIEGLIVFVQTLRLHWVEWFSKFYEGGGVSFAPYQEPTGWMLRVNG